MKHLTIRNVPDELHDALIEERQHRGQSLNQTVIELLGERLGIRGRFSNGLSALAGDWSEEELRQFEQATASFGQIDEELWA